MGVEGWRVSYDLFEAIGIHIQQILPFVNTINATGWSPFNKEQLSGILDVTGRLMGLVSELLDMLNRGFGAYDTEEFGIIDHEVGCVDVLQPGEVSGTIPIVSQLFKELAAALTYLRLG